MDDGIKRKLVGAGALVIAGLLVLPLISPQTKNAQYLQQSVPEMPEAPDMTMSTPKALDIEVSDLINPKQAATKPKSVTINEVVIDDEVVPASNFDLPEKTNTGQAQTWQIQVASFAKAANALTLRDKLRAQGMQAYEQLAQDGVHTRVFVGPSFQKSELEQLLPQIANTYKVKPQIVPFQPRAVLNRAE